MENTLSLTLKKKWFDMILSGEKKEEYREIKDYWTSRLCNMEILERNNEVSGYKFIGFKYFDTITFKNGYGKDAPTIIAEFRGIQFGNALPEWSDNWQGSVFKILIGNILSTNNLNA